MPTYDYVCSKCDNKFELYQPISEEPKRTCPKCKGKLKRLIGGGGGLIFKGSGFYLTDYRSEGYTKRAKEEASGGGESAATKKDGSASEGGAKTDSKSGAKTDAAPKKDGGDAAKKSDKSDKAKKAKPD